MIDKLINKKILTILLLFFIQKPSALLAADVIASPNVQTTSLSLNQLRHIFFMRVQEWPDGTPIKVYVLNDNNELHKQFSKEKLGVFPYKLRRLWDRNIFSGTGQAPTVLDNELDMIKIISASQGGIGYASKTIINGSSQGVFNVLFIDVE